MGDVLAAVPLQAGLEFGETGGDERRVRRSDGRSEAPGLDIKAVASLEQATGP